MNQLILGDCLEVLKTLASDSVDLIYLDPPFFSNRNYEVIWGDKGEIRSFEDRWSGGVDHYIAWLKERVEEMHRVLKPTGSIFLHCDWHANAEIKVFILNKIFGYENFNGEIVWQRAQAHNDAKKKIGVLSDTIWYFSKSKKVTYHPIYGDLGDASQKMFKNFDERGAYRYIILTAPNIRYGESGQEWRGYNPTNIGRSWAVPNLVVEELVGKEKCESMGVLEKLDLLYDKGFISFSKNGIPSVKKYLDQSKGVILGNIWTDISFGAGSKERIGYPTQKPEALLERIINMASNEDDIVLDPFNGGGTTVAVANRLNRQWIGIDSSVSAIKVTEYRLDAQHGNALKGQTSLHSFSDLFKPFTVQLHKYDYDTLRYKDAFEFEKFIVQQIGGLTNNKQRNDLGLDGKTKDGIPIQVKRSDNIGRNVIDNFQSACKRFDNALFERNQSESKPIGVIIAFSFGKGATQEVARLKNQENIIIQLLKVEDIIPIAKKPTLTVAFNDCGLDAKQLREIEFIATGHSEAGIEFYAWDWSYENQQFNFAIVNDKIGKQTQKFKAGTHCIAVKVVDNDGLESIEVITLKINGGVAVLPLS
ncbi:MAG: DNA methyltransferase [Methylococcales bacterium]